MNDMHELGLKHGADKAGDHHQYTLVYPNYLGKYRDRPLTLIELGTYKGASCRMWDEYFTHPKAKLIGYDFKKKRVTKSIPDSPRWTGVQGDQWDFVHLMSVASDHGPFDVVIDDCVHGAQPQEFTFRAFWPHIKPGGVHVIEDINFSSYNTLWYTTRVRSGPKSVMPFLNTLLDELLQAGESGDTDIDYIHFHRHICFIGKKP